VPDKLLRALLLVLFWGAAAAAPASAGAVTVGISDQSPAMFSSPYFKALHIKQARLMVAWNAAVMRNRTALNQARAWIAAAQADGVQPLIDFQADPGKAGNYVPTVKQYTMAVKAFIHDFPTIKQYVPWNEPDWIYRSLSRNPRLAAEYYNALVQACGGGCTVVAGDLYLDAGHLGAWVRAYEKWVRYRPRVWALHPYDDIQGHTTSQIQVMLKYMTPGAQLWLTEISGVVRRGHWHGGLLHQSLAKQAADERFLFSLPSRFRRITRIYHYQWQGTVPSPNTGWDSGLLNPNGTPRPAYYVVRKAATGR
jgi:hypothetical protein